MYKVTEGYNLEANDKTFWDQNNVYDLIVSRRVGSKSPHGFWPEARDKLNNSALAILENVKSGNDVPTLDPLNSEHVPNFGEANSHQVSPTKFNLQQPLSPIPGVQAAVATKSPKTFLKQMAQQNTAHMTLEEKILNGVFKPDI